MRVLRMKKDLSVSFSPSSSAIKRDFDGLNREGKRGGRLLIMIEDLLKHLKSFEKWEG
jgi:hypothetical protein